MLRMLRQQKQQAENDVASMDRNQVQGFACATLAHALIQGAVHFPDLLKQIGLSPEDALSRAFVLAEQAIALAPEVPDGHAALGRCLLCHDDSDASEDAVALLEHALVLEADHDASEVALATALRACGQKDDALQHVERVIRRGNGLPFPFVLRGLLLSDAGRAEEARADFERALRLAPEAGLFALEAAYVCEAAGHQQKAEAYRKQAMQLLGDAFELMEKALKAGNSGDVST